MADKRALYLAMEDWKIAVDRVRMIQKQINDLNDNVAKFNGQIASAQANLATAMTVEADRFLAIEAAMK